MTETHQLLSIVAMVESVHNSSGLRGGDVVINLQVGVQPSLTMQTCQRQCLGSHHPQRLTLPSKVNLQPVVWKNTLQPAL